MEIGSKKGQNDGLVKIHYFVEGHHLIFFNIKFSIFSEISSSLFDSIPVIYFLKNVCFSEKRRSSEVNNNSVVFFFKFREQKRNIQTGFFIDFFCSSFIRLIRNGSFIIIVLELKTLVVKVKSYISFKFTENIRYENVNFVN